MELEDLDSRIHELQQYYNSIQGDPQNTKRLQNVKQNLEYYKKLKHKYLTNATIQKKTKPHTSYLSNDPTDDLVGDVDMNEILSHCRSVQFDSQNSNNIPTTTTTTTSTTNSHNKNTSKKNGGNYYGSQMNSKYNEKNGGGAEHRNSNFMTRNSDLSLKRDSNVQLNDHHGPTLKKQKQQNYYYPLISSHEKHDIVYNKNNNKKDEIDRNFNENNNHSNDNISYPTFPEWEFSTAKPSIEKYNNMYMPLQYSSPSSKSQNDNSNPVYHSILYTPDNAGSPSFKENYKKDQQKQQQQERINPNLTKSPHQISSDQKAENKHHIKPNHQGITYNDKNEQKVTKEKQNSMSELENEILDKESERNLEEELETVELKSENIPDNVKPSFIFSQKEDDGDNMDELDDVEGKYSSDYGPGYYVLSNVTRNHDLKNSSNLRSIRPDLDIIGTPSDKLENLLDQILNTEQEIKESEDDKKLKLLENSEDGNGDDDNNNNNDDGDGDDDDDDDDSVSIQKELDVLEQMIEEEKLHKIEQKGPNLLLETKYKNDVEKMVQGLGKILSAMSRILPHKYQKYKRLQYDSSDEDSPDEIMTVFKSSNDQVISKEQVDERLIEKYKSGKESITNIRSGTKRIILPNHHIIIKYKNGDFKKIVPKVRIEHYHHQQMMYHVVFANKDQFFYYLSVRKIVKLDEEGNRITANVDDGSKLLSTIDNRREYCFRNGSKKIVYPDGQIDVILNDGSRFSK